MVEVTDQLVELGNPVDRAAFGAAAGSEPFNGLGGVQDIYFDAAALSASWSGIFQDEAGEVGDAYFHYLIGFDGAIRALRPPLIFVEDGVRTFEDNAADNVASLRAWAAGRGLVSCTGC